MIISDDTKLQQSVQLDSKNRTLKYEALQNYSYSFSINFYNGNVQKPR